MKKILALILAIIFALSLCGCANENESIVCGPGENLDNSGVVSEETTESKEQVNSQESEPTNTSSKVKNDKRIEKIVDKTHKYLKTGKIIKFYEEDYYEYFTVSGMKDGIMVYFKDGTKMGVVEAFKNKLVTLSDLKKYNVKYIKEFAGSQIFDLTEFYNCNTKKKTQEFYKDENFSYTFSTQKADYVKYVDNEGKTLTVGEALKKGKIKLYDIGNAAVDFDKKYLGNELLIVNESEGYCTTQALAEFYRDDNYKYEFSDGRCVVVYYPDGTNQGITEALQSGKVKVTDLEKFGIKYIQRPIDEE